MAMRVSRSGGWISTIRPHSKRERRRSSSVTMALGGRSEESTICLSCAVQGVEGVEELLLGGFLAGDELDVIDQQHVDAAVVVAEVAACCGLRMALIRSLVNSSEETYSTVRPWR